MPSLEAQSKLLMEMKYTQRMTKKRSNKARTAITQSEDKLKKELQAGRPEIARLAAATVIRKRQMHLELEKLYYEIDQVIDVLESATTMRQVAGDLKRVTGGMERAQKSEVDPAKINDIMARFNSTAEDMRMTSSMFTGAMNERGASSSNVEEEDKLMNRAQEEMGIKLSQEMPDTAAVAEAKPAANEEQREQKLAEQLRKLTT